MAHHGLINAHTHLELGLLADICPTNQPFEDWLIELLRRRATLNERDFAVAIERALANLHATGTVAVGDISSTGLSVIPLLQSGLGGVVYFEVLGFDPFVAMDRFTMAQRKIDTWRAREGHMRVGLSVHAPYSCAPILFQAATVWSIQEDVPLAIHLAESPAEVQFLQEGSGSLMNLAKRFTPQTKWQAPQCSPVQYLANLGVLEAKPTLIHGVQVDENDLAIIKAAGCVVVHCPRSNANLMCGRMPLERYLAHGIPVALGTDSLASSPSLDLGDELLFAEALHHDKVPFDVIKQLAHEERWWRPDALAPKAILRGEL